MTESILASLIEERYEDLASSIIIQAADDYKRYRFVLDTIDLRDYKNDLSKYNAINRAKREVLSVERFFKSTWFNELTNLNGAKALAALEKTYIDEYYPVRMEELLDRTKIGRFRTK